MNTDKLPALKVDRFSNIPKGYTGIAELFDGTKYWYKNGKFHREDGPAIEYLDGTKIWFKNGEHHREDGPAVEHMDGTKHWYLNRIRYTFNDFFEATTAEGKEAIIWKMNEYR